MDLLRFMTAGSVDDGKSTLIGRLFHDAGMILEDQMKAISKQGLNLAHFTDGLKEEREKSITIDVAYRYFETQKRKFIVADAPGHAEFTRNMVTGATNADAILILVDATRGIGEQTRRHFFIAAWLGIKSVLVLINKMDLIDYDESCFKKLEKEIQALGNCEVIPIAALHGENILEKSQKMGWYEGSNLFEKLHQLPGTFSHVNDHSFFPVQIAYKSAVAGNLKMGKISKKDRLHINGSESQVEVSGIFKWPHEVELLEAGDSARIEISKELKRGDFLTNAPQKYRNTKKIQAQWCYLIEAPAELDHSFTLRFYTNELSIKHMSISHVFDLSNNEWNPTQIMAMQMNQIYQGEIEFHAPEWTSVDGFFALLSNSSGKTLAAGKFTEEGLS